ncbi:hypothetical protein SPRG_11952 [Saprolegnia parasitica CBS 223.65]|uniref:Uncharacterized protein n=1 Tax=Saprolegnia parasitica (strain CBS 223.65) TaxID=695850 RepID=A0A067BXV9_SAPPC|nr:hypothetical protein SPRG_11952 [Saprolegnia parasitica CBS 223.65]KDO23108.1 hypothetical protein SPRG_11952 [Saprolegnia parasitica CBS 223.65]|eukprot:XP_012206219.1 hypothetical protein SPRG_11952 [Saprolegnia parasitica CBS 223.65]
MDGNDNAVHRRKGVSAMTHVAAMVDDDDVQAAARRKGLHVVNVAWEDCARFIDRCWGPCISDMTLVTRRTRMPVLRAPNFQDPIMRIPTRQIMLTVGNESPYEDAPLTKISLQEYLETITKYTELEHSIYAPQHDDQAVVSTQACFLPIEKEAESKTEFHVGLFNYQSRADDPAVLVLVCTDAGTSAQVVSQRDTALFCNHHGLKHSFAAERLSQDRAKRGVDAADVAMTADEEARNYVMIVQIPLQQKPKPTLRKVARSRSARPNNVVAPSRVDVEAAIISISDDAKGPYPKLSRFSHVQRDTRYPLRVTVQFYQATSNGRVTPNVVRALAKKMASVKANATWWGSLVTANASSSGVPSFVAKKQGAKRKHV